MAERKTVFLITIFEGGRRQGEQNSSQRYGIANFFYKLYTTFPITEIPLKSNHKQFNTLKLKAGSLIEIHKNLVDKYTFTH